MLVATPMNANDPRSTSVVGGTSALHAPPRLDASAFSTGAFAAAPYYVSASAAAPTRGLASAMPPPYPFSLLSMGSSSDFDILPAASYPPPSALAAAAAAAAANAPAPAPTQALLPANLNTTNAPPTHPTTSPALRQMSSLFSPPKAPQKWTPEEDDLLRESVARLGSKKWKLVAQNVPGRSHIQCLQRWNKVLKPGIKKGAWTPDEDELVRRSVDEQTLTGSTVNWAVVATAVPGRTAKQCRERWRCNLDPLILKADWTKEEDEMLFALQRELGNRWALISKSLPGRTENAIKTRFRSFLRAEKKKWSVAEDATVRLHMDGALSLEDALASLPGRTRNAIRKRAASLKAATAAANYSSSAAASSAGSSPAMGGGVHHLAAGGGGGARPVPDAAAADGALVKRARLVSAAADAAKRGRDELDGGEEEEDDDDDEDDDEDATASDADSEDPSRGVDENQAEPATA